MTSRPSSDAALDFAARMFWSHIAPMSLEGYTQAEIADRLNATGIKCRAGGYWDQPKVSRIITRMRGRVQRRESTMQA